MFTTFPRAVLRSAFFTGSLFGAASKMESSSSTLPVRAYKAKNPDAPFPYSTTDLTPMDAGNDNVFYAPPRFVTHIDDNAIANLKQYYEHNLPRTGSILDFCSSWISHYPPAIEQAAKSGELVVFGTGMNEQELRRNPVLRDFSVQDLNEKPDVKIPSKEVVELDASTCVVSIDYLTKPVDVLSSIRRQTKPGGKVHLAISNRCFPTKAVGRWLRIDESARLDMVGDYLWYAGFRNIEIVTVVEASFFKDPLWVVRGENEQA